MLSLHHHQMLPGITINPQMLPGIASLALPLSDPSFPWNELNMVATSLTTTAAPKQQPGCWVLMPPFAASSMPPPMRWRLLRILLGRKSLGSPKRQPTVSRQPTLSQAPTIER